MVVLQEGDQVLEKRHAPLAAEHLDVLKQEELRRDLLNEPGEFEHERVPLIPQMRATFLLREALARRAPGEQVESVAWRASQLYECLARQSACVRYEGTVGDVAPVGSHGRFVGVERRQNLETRAVEAEAQAAGA